jgi:hypothetical protein
MSDKNLGAKLAESAIEAAVFAASHVPHKNAHAKWDAGWLIDDNADGPATMKLVCWAVLTNQFRAGVSGGSSAKLVKACHLMKDGFWRELLPGGLGPKTVTAAHLDLREIVADADHVVIDAVGSGTFRRVSAGPYKMHIIGDRDGRDRKIEVKVGSHRDSTSEKTVVLELTKHEVWVLHPDLIARDVTDEPANAPVELVEP